MRIVKINQFNRISVWFNSISERIKKNDAIVFFDEWLLVDDDLDSLAHYCCQDKALDELTTKTDTWASLSVNAKLQVINPSISELLTWFESSYIPKLQNSSKFIVKHLISEGKNVFYLSDTFNLQAEAVAKKLGIPRENVRAHELFYTKRGRCKGFSKLTSTAKMSREERLFELRREFDCKGVLFVAGNLMNKQQFIEDKYLSSEEEEETEEGVEVKVGNKQHDDHFSKDNEKVLTETLVERVAKSAKNAEKTNFEQPFKYTAKFFKTAIYRGILSVIALTKHMFKRK